MQGSGCGVYGFGVLAVGLRVSANGFKALGVGGWV